MIITFIWTVSIAFVALGMIWTSEDWFNVLCKTAMYSAAIWGFYLIFKVLP